MRFDSVKMTNYRQYKDVEFEFEKALTTDIHVIKASNGVGKTNLLNAINWCLYGDEPHMSTDDNKLSICTEDVLKEAKLNGEQICEVKVEIKGTDKGSTITATRRIKVNSSNGNLASKDELIVREDFPQGGTEYYEKDNARLRIEAMFPIGIREYFFFDGEQLLNYFGEKTNTTAIKDSIYRIAQINSIEEAHAHLDDIIRKYNKEIGDMQPKLMEVLRKKEDAENALENKKKEIELLKEQIRISKVRIRELDGLIAGSKDAVQANEKRNENLATIKKLTDEKIKILDQLRNVVREYTILLYLYDVNKKAFEYILEEERKGNLNPNIDTDIILRSLERHRCVVCDEELTSEVERHLNELVESVKISSATTKIFTTMRTELNRALLDARKYKEEKENLVSTYAIIQGQIDDLESENEALSERIKMCSDIKGAASYMEEKENHERTMHANMTKQGKYESSLDELQRRVASLQDEYEKLEKESKVNDEIKRYRDFALEARKIVVDIEDEMVQEVKSRMERKTKEFFDQLIWKKNTYHHVELDSNFKFQLFNMERKSCFGTCSAAEKELLALAFTIALHEVSGYNNLLFIDTPVGRVSDLNRSNFASVLKEISENKQIILAFTPSEYSDEISRVLDDTVVSSFNELSSNETNTERK